MLRCYLLSKSTWLNPIDAKWAHGKRRVVEPARLLTAAELRARVCAAFDCPEEDLLGLPDPLDAHRVIPKEVACSCTSRAPRAAPTILPHPCSSQSRRVPRRGR